MRIYGFIPEIQAWRFLKKDIKYNLKNGPPFLFWGFLVFCDASATDRAEGDLDSQRTGQENPPKIEFTPISIKRPAFVMAFNKKKIK